MDPARSMAITAGPPRPAGGVDGPETRRGYGRDLLPTSWRRHLASIVAASALWVAAWAVAVHGGRRPLAVERPLNDLLTRLHPQLHHVAAVFADLNHPPVFAGLMALMLGLCAWGRSPRAAITMAVALVVTLGLVEVLKEVVGRVNITGTLTFPSGHVGVTSVLATVVILLARRGGPLGRRLPDGARVAILAVALASVVAVAVSMVVLGDHYVTDTIAAAPIGLSVTLVVAAVADSRAATARAAGSRAAGSQPADPRDGRGAPGH
jgi:membrane-associated phospholipid phosphatase